MRSSIEKPRCVGSRHWLSHRRIGELTGLSHTRVNQILGIGTKRPPDDIHFPPGFLPPPTTVSTPALRIIAEEGPRAWAPDEIATELNRRGWPATDLEATLVDLVTDGVLLPSTPATSPFTDTATQAKRPRDPRPA